MRRVAGIGGVIALLVGTPAIGLLNVTSAAAAGGITCANGSGTAQLSPGLTNTPTMQKDVARGTVSNCSGSPFTGAKTLTHLKSGPGATCSALGTVTGTDVLKWSPHGSGNSVALITISPTGHLSGTVMRGPFAGMSLSTDVTSTPVPFKHKGAPCTKGNAVKKFTYVLTSPFVIS